MDKLAWYWVLLIGVGVTAVIAYFLWPPSMAVKANIKYNPLTGTAIPAGTTTLYDPNTGVACTS
jgi:hypothetical protein